MSTEQAPAPTLSHFYLLNVTIAHEEYKGQLHNQFMITTKDGEELLKLMRYTSFGFIHLVDGHAAFDEERALYDTFNKAQKYKFVGDNRTGGSWHPIDNKDIAKISQKEGIIVDRVLELHVMHQRS
jgi:hypothetical protein